MSAGPRVSRRRLALVTLAGVLLGATPVTAQRPTGYSTGSCDVAAVVWCESLDARQADGELEREWLRAAVLWRSGLNPRRGVSLARIDTTAMRSAVDAYSLLRIEAERKGHIMLGGQSGDRWTASFLSGRSQWPGRRSTVDTLLVLDEAFVLPERDSAVVVLVDGVFGGPTPPRIVEVLRVPSPSRVSAKTKRWTSGDTTFIVQPKKEGPSGEEFLRSIPAVRNFIDGGTP